MARFVLVPAERMDAEVLRAMLEEYASRDGTDYGVREMALDDKVARLRRQLTRGDLAVVYDLKTEHWDLLDRPRLQEVGL